MSLNERSNTKIVGQATRALLLGTAALYSTAAIDGPPNAAEACAFCAYDATYVWCSWSGGVVGANTCFTENNNCFVSGWCC